jgi:hypothetical protein
LGYVVLRTGGLVPAAVVHALLNLATIVAMSGHAPDLLRTAFSAVALISVVTATILPGQRLGILRHAQMLADDENGSPLIAPT